MVASVLPLFLRPSPLGDWGQQELAEFYRVESVLVQSGVSIETDRGVSDEGDPWFVFCRPQTGDVIVHFARHGREYIAAGGALGRVFKGRDFRSIIDEFISLQPVVMSRPGAQPQLYVHPAAMLSAFVATAYFLLTSVERDDAEASNEAPAPHAKLPPAFLAMMEAAGLTTNREAWIALGSVAIAFSLISVEWQSGEPALATRLDVVLNEEASNAQQTADDETRHAAAEWSPQAERAQLSATLIDSDLLATPSAPTGDEPRAPAILAAQVLEAAPGKSQQDSHQDAAPRLTLLADDQAHNVASQLAQDQGGEPNALAQTPQTSNHAPGQIWASREGSEAQFLVRDSLELAGHALSAEALAPGLMDALAAAALGDGHVKGGVFSADVTGASVTNVGAVYAVGAKGETFASPAAATTEADSFSAIVTGNDPEALAMRALEWFAAEHPDFKVVSLGRHVVVFDLDNVHQDQNVSLAVHTWMLDDGSTVNIIGSLPDIFTLAA
jgi:hypothetical protein